MTTSLDTSERATAAMRPQCKSCGATTVRDLGPLPEPVPTFGGQPCPVSIAPGRLSISLSYPGRVDALV